MPGHTPAYTLEDFQAACGVSGKVTVSNAARKDAVYFALHGEEAILKWIAKVSPKSLIYRNTEPWKKCAPVDKGTLMDGYFFTLGTKYGYLAFAYQARKEKWFLKSFKPNDRHDKREGSTMFAAMKKAGI